MSRTMTETGAIPRRLIRARVLLSSVVAGELQATLGNVFAYDERKNAPTGARTHLERGIEL